MIIEVRLSDEDVQRIAGRIVEFLPRTGEVRHDWLDVSAAAAHLSFTENAIRGLLKRKQIPFHRTENGRIRFLVTELDRWAQSGLAD